MGTMKLLAKDKLEATQQIASAQALFCRLSNWTGLPNAQDIPRFALLLR